MHGQQIIKKHLSKIPVCTDENFAWNFSLEMSIILENLTRVKEIECPYVVTFPCWYEWL